MRKNNNGVSAKETSDLRDDPEGVYANTFKVGFNAYEFVLDFGQYFNGKDKERFLARIVTNPEYVESFYEILGESIRKYKTEMI